MKGIPLDVIERLRAATQRKLIVAGGIRNMQEVEELDRLGSGRGSRHGAVHGCAAGVQTRLRKTVLKRHSFVQTWNGGVVRSKVGIMKFPGEFVCACGNTVSVSTYGDCEWPSAVCPKCQSFAVPIEPLSVSPTAERLLHRSKHELATHDYSLAIVIATFAVEAFLGGLFLKARKMALMKASIEAGTTESYGSWRSEELQKIWKDEFKKKRGFANATNFVSKVVTGISFDEFVTTNKVATQIMTEFPDAGNESSQQNIFRNISSTIATKSPIGDT